MKWNSIAFVALLTTLLMGCSSLPLADDDVATGDQALTGDEGNCEEQCQEQFHECRESPDRGGGPGASACAHERNDCQDRC